MAERYALDLPLRPLVPVQIGDVVTSETLRQLATLEFFAASIADVPVEKLRLGHLVKALAHPPARTQSDPPAPRTRAADSYRPIP
jgi:hypothetical protein